MFAHRERRVKDGNEMAAFTTTAVERFIRGGVPTGKPHASLRDGDGFACGSCPPGRPRGNSSIASAALVDPARRRPSRSARGPP